MDPLDFRKVDHVDLVRLGWRENDSAAFASHAARGLVPARVVLDYGPAYRVLGTFGERSARVPSLGFDS